MANLIQFLAVCNFANKCSLFAYVIRKFLLVFDPYKKTDNWFELTERLRNN